MSVERRLVETLAAFDGVEPAPDLFRRVERSVADDLERRRRIRMWTAGVLGFVSLAVIFVASNTTVSSVGIVVVDVWSLIAVETMLLIGIVLTFGPLIRRFGAVFVEDVFGETEEAVGAAFLRLLDVAYYLVFVGYVILTVPIADLGRQLALGPLLEVSTERLGGLLLVMGAMHAATITALPLIGLIHASTLREQQRAAVQPLPRSTPQAALAERVVRIVLWTAGGLAASALAAVLLNIVVGILLGFEG